jgi:hypothetical protein
MDEFPASAGSLFWFSYQCLRSKNVTLSNWAQSNNIAGRMAFTHCFLFSVPGGPICNDMTIPKSGLHAFVNNF